MRGGGAWCNDEPIRVSEIDSVASAQVLYAGAGAWLRPVREEDVLSLLSDAKRTRGFGDFWGHMLVARGSAEVMVEPDLALWDYAALVPIVEEAGGRVTAIDGGPLRHEGSVLTTNGVIHEEIVRRLSGTGLR